MEGNRDESEKCIKLAEKCARAGDKDKALKFLLKAEKLFPSQRAKGIQMASQSPFLKVPFLVSQHRDRLSITISQLLPVGVGTWELYSYTYSA